MCEHQKNKEATRFASSAQIDRSGVEKWGGPLFECNAQKKKGHKLGRYAQKKKEKKENFGPGVSVRQPSKMTTVSVGNNRNE